MLQPCGRVQCDLLSGAEGAKANGPRLFGWPVHRLFFANAVRPDPWVRKSLIPGNGQTALSPSFVAR